MANGSPPPRRAEDLRTGLAWAAWAGTSVSNDRYVHCRNTRLWRPGGSFGQSFFCRIGGGPRSKKSAVAGGWICEELVVCRFCDKVDWRICRLLRRAQSRLAWADSLSSRRHHCPRRVRQIHIHPLRRIQLHSYLPSVSVCSFSLYPRW